MELHILMHRLILMKKDAEAVYIPDDAGMKYYDMQKTSKLCSPI